MEGNVWLWGLAKDSKGLLLEEKKLMSPYKLDIGDHKVGRELGCCGVWVALFNGILLMWMGV